MALPTWRGEVTAGIIANRRLQQLLFALLVASASLALIVFTRRVLPPGHSDFGAVWFGARSLVHGVNPYPLVGPGLQFDWAFRLNYPATAFVAAIPFSILSEDSAANLFIFLSTFLLAYGIHGHRPHLVWMLPSAAFVVAARAAQWSPLLAACYIIPSFGVILAAKPSTGLAVAVSGWAPFKYAVSGAVVLGLLSLLLCPSWPAQWFSVIGHSWEFSPPVTRPAGFLMVLAALKWRTPEGRFLLALSLVPQTSSWYEGLLPMLVAKTKPEAQILSMTSSVGYLLLIPLAISTGNVSSAVVGSMMVAFCYLPALIVVLRRA